MAELIIHGVPNGHQVSKCDKDMVDFFGLFYDNSDGIKTKVSRKNNDVIYNYLVYGKTGANFGDYNGRPGSYFGMSLVFHNRCAVDSNQVFNLLKTVYDNYVKNKIIQESPNGARKWLYQNIETPGDEIATYLAKGMNQIIQVHPELTPKTQTLPPLQNLKQRY